MALKKIKLGELIELTDRYNTDEQYGMDYVRGISNAKQIMSSKADVDPSIVYKFYIVNPNEFIYNPRTTRMGDKVGLGFNDTNSPLLFSFNNIAFKIKESAQKEILPEYLYLFYNRPEFDRYAIVNSWGSATELFTFDEMCDIELELPSPEIQQKYVNIYKAMVENQKSYERGLDDLKLVCDAYIEDLRRKMPCEKIGSYIEEFNKKNDGGLTLESVRGIATNKEFIDTKANMDGVPLNGYKITEPSMIAFISDTSRRGDKISLALNQSEASYLVSSISTVFKTDQEKLLPKFVYLFFIRTEFDRYTRFHSWGSAREVFLYEDMCDVCIPIPDKNIQKAIVDIYDVYKQRKEINEKLKQQIKDICPILIKGSIEEAKKEA